MARYYCTCECPVQKALYPTEVRDDGICVKCGYYAFAKPNIEHLYFPRDETFKWNTEPMKTAWRWSKLGMYNEYCLYFHGHECGNQGLGDNTMRKEQKRIRDAKKLKRVNGNRG